MENITEWAGKIDKNVRNKPNKQLQDELIKRVITVLNEGTNTYDESVAAFFRFDAKVLVPFYQDYYPTDIPDRKQWDEAVIRWANSKKPTIPATIRVAIILQEKLAQVEFVDEVIPEIKWLAMHEDDRSITSYSTLRRQYLSSGLRKMERHGHSR